MVVQPIITIKFEDGTDVAVTDLPTNIQELVSYYNDFRQQEADSRSAFVMATAAVKDITREITASVKKWQEEKAAATLEVKSEAPASQ